MRKLGERMSVALRPGLDTMDSRPASVRDWLLTTWECLGLLPVGFRWRFVYIEDAFSAVRAVTFAARAGDLSLLRDGDGAR
ncbi:hypothetical protein ACFWAY_34795 [Rhodococcus sp. NPDC059968]|uniref:hypothetical protein n=1 Tax=Rhodococcus sp. NPDC059968 TaxID=3347017 RepID=UPI00366CCF0E